MLQQHVEEHVCRISACDGDILAQARAGVPQGSAAACDIFNDTYASSICAYNRGVEALDGQLVAKSVLSDECINFLKK